MGGRINAILRWFGRRRTDVGLSPGLNVDKKQARQAHSSQVFERLKIESDRGCVLVGTAFVESALRLLLQAAFVCDAKHTKRLLDGDRPLFGSLWAKNVVAYAFGLIPKELHEAIDTLREIRNDFAHLPGRVELSFQDARIASLTTRLLAYVEAASGSMPEGEARAKLASVMSKYWTNATATRVFFEVCVGILCTWIDLLQERADRHAP